MTNPILVRKRILELIDICQKSRMDRDVVNPALQECTQLIRGLEKNSPVSEHLSELVLRLLLTTIVILTEDENKRLIEHVVQQDPKLAIEVMLEDMSPEEIEKLRQRAVAEKERRRPKLVKKKSDQ
jgi:hypothetical protein